MTRSEVDLEGDGRAGRRALVVAGLLGATGVLLGAFGAHGLKGLLADVSDGATRLEWWDTASRYQLWHALLVSLLALRADRSSAARTGVVLGAVGVLLFSGSLYTMTLTGLRALGAVTPLGGLAFVGAWLCLAWSARAPGPSSAASASG